MHLLERIDQWGRVAPDQCAHVSGSRRLSYAELTARSDALATTLLADLGDSRAPIALRGHKEPEMLIGFLAAVKSGRPYIPIDDSIPETRAQTIIQNSGAAVVLTPERIAALSDTPAARELRPVTGEDPFYILYTSGSTGEPKGVVITQVNLQTFLDWMLAEQQFAAQSEVFLNQAPFSFDLSVMDLYLSLVTGGTLFSITKEEIANLKKLYEAFAQSQISTWVSTPSFAQMCLIERGFNQTMLPALRRFLFCGETLAPDTAAQLLERFPQAAVWNTYGPTETTVATTSVRIDRETITRFPALPVGYPMPGTRVLIRQENGQFAPPGERGEIVVLGTNVSPGYLGRPDLNEKAFFTHGGCRGYRTGDWGRECDGLIFFEGRIDGQVKVNGYRIELGDLEANLRALPEIVDAVVLPVQKRERIDSLAAFVVLSETKSVSDFEMSARLKARLSERLPNYMLPRKFYFLDTLPMTPNGKADRRKLAERL